MTTLTELLNNPEVHYPGNFDTPERANALLTGLCQDAAIEIERLQAEILEQCRINGMSADREDALRARNQRLEREAEANIKDAYRAGVDSGIAAERERCCAIVFGLCESDNVAQKTVDAIRSKGDT